MTARVCVACGSEPRRIIARGLCDSCYRKNRRDGTLNRFPPTRRNRPVEDRFWEKVDKTADCWIWTANKDHSGYGHIKVEGRGRTVHHLVYEMLVGQIPDGLTVDHLCFTPSCVNPAHLRLLTPSENSRRRQTYRSTLSTHCVNGHPYTENTAIDDHGWRVCAACRRRAREERGRTPRKESA